MATITPGNGATAKSSTIEGQLWEVANIIHIAQTNTAINNNGKSALSIATSNANVATVSANFPYTSSPDDNGSTVISVTKYLDNLTFTPGSDGTFLSSNEAAYLIEVAEEMQRQEAGTSFDNISLTFDSDTKIASLTANIPIERTVQNDGTVKVTAKEYL